MADVSKEQYKKKWDEVGQVLRRLIARKAFGNNFNVARFKESQARIVMDIAVSFLIRIKPSYIIEAPTGSGKSYIGIVTAAILNEMGYTGYYLVSDISLQNQIENDLSGMKLKWGTIKGQDNFTCDINGEVFSRGVCSSKNVSISVAEEEYECAGLCGYIRQRKLAKEASTTIMNYFYWLVQLNQVYKKLGENAPFKPRDFIVCDEAHNIGDIVQSQFSPEFRDSLTIEFGEFINEFGDETGTHLTESSETIRDFHDTFRVLMTPSDQLDKQTIYTQLKNIIGLLKRYDSEFNSYQTRIQKEIGANEDIPNEHKKHFKRIKRFAELTQKMEAYIFNIDKTNISDIVKSDIMYNEYVIGFSLKCLNDSYLMKEYFHSVSNYQIYMSATIGKATNFANVIALDDYRYLSVGSNFDFSNSPIFLVRPSYKLSYKTMKEYVPILIEQMDEIISRYHQNDRGIIQVTSYKLAKQILDNSKHKNRIIAYDGEKGSKQAALDMLNNSANGIIIGPSLSQGISLDDDLSRFQILFKVPYASIGDAYVKEKMNQDYMWYQWLTVTKILQMLGRSIRNKNDFAKTYLMDGSFSEYFGSMRHLPEWVTNRVKIMNL